MVHLKKNGTKIKLLSQATPPCEDIRCKKCGQIFDAGDKRRVCFDICSHVACLKCLLEMCDGSGCTFCSEPEPENYAVNRNGASAEPDVDSDDLPNGNADEVEEPPSYILSSILTPAPEVEDEDEIEFPVVEKMVVYSDNRDQQTAVVYGDVESLQTRKNGIAVIDLSTDDEDDDDLIIIMDISSEGNESGNCHGPPLKLSQQNGKSSVATAPKSPQHQGNLFLSTPPGKLVVSLGEGCKSSCLSMTPPTTPEDDKETEPAATPPNGIVAVSQPPRAVWRRREGHNGSSVSSSDGDSTSTASSNSSSSSSFSSGSSENSSSARKRRRRRRSSVNTACRRNKMPSLSSIIDEDFNMLNIMERNADVTMQAVEERAPELTPVTMNTTAKKHGSEKSRCRLCPKQFVGKRRLGNHLLNAHSDKLPFHCDLCGWSFASKERLETHRRWHIKNRAHKCQKCPATFNGRKGLYRHVRHVHSKKPETPLVEANKPIRKKVTTCPYCKEAFQNQSERGIHLRKNHPEKRSHICTKCSVSFKREIYLKRHMLSHSQSRMHYCPMCDDKFVRKSRLELHFESEHGFRVRFKLVEKVMFNEYCPECQTLFDEDGCVKAAYMTCGHVSCLKCVIRAELGCGQCTTETAVAGDKNLKEKVKKRPSSKPVASVPPILAELESNKLKKKRRRVVVIAEEDEPPILAEHQNTSAFRGTRETRKLRRSLARTTR